MLHDSKLFFRRRFRKRQHQVESLGSQAENTIERYFFRRLDRLTAVRRFVITWLLLVGLLCGCLVGQIRALDGYFQTLKPTPGGVYTEGILGDFTNANPLYAAAPADETVSRLLFASLFKYDSSNHLVGDLAKDYTVDETGKVYTVHLKPHLTWHDGAPLTSRDVEFTYRMIQNPDAQSVLRENWQGVTVAATDDGTITFTLPNALASFPYDMTNGIIPEHVLKDTAPAEMRSASFNTDKPVGAGPFAWRDIQVSGDSPETRQAQLALIPFKHYNGGTPKLAVFVVHAFHDADQLTLSFKNRQLTAANFTDMPEDILDDRSVRVNSFMLSAAEMVFMRHSNPVLADAAVRKSLVEAVNVQAIIDDLGYPTRPVREPFLLGQLGYDKAFVQPAYNPEVAEQQLDAAGWKTGADGMRAKAGQPLRFTLYAQDKPESRHVSAQLANAWHSIGVQADVTLQNSDDLQRTVTNHGYDALLYGISIGEDPDVFAYWHSSQNDARSSRLNFSEFSSKSADTALEAGRTRIAPKLRAVKYRPFLQAWQQDVPALGLYQPRFLYLTHGTVYGLKEHVLTGNTDRFANVQNWQIRQVETTNK